MVLDDRRGVSTRERILAAAETLFGERGYASTAMEDIGKAVGITAGGIYRHFASKQAILGSIAERAARAVISEVEAIVAESRSPDDTLVALVENLVAAVLQNRHLVRVLSTERQHLDEPTQAFVDRIHRLHVAEWVHALSQLRPEMSEGAKGTRVQAAYGALLGAAGYDSGIAEDDLRQMLVEIALDVLGLAVDTATGRDRESAKDGGR